MSNSNPQRSGEQDADALREALHGRAEYIQHKFEAQRADDIEPDYLRQTLAYVKSWSQASPSLQRSEIMKARNVENHIYAAVSLYKESTNRYKYFDELRIIADQLKRI